MQANKSTADNSALAESALRAFAPDYPLYGYMTAAYARPVELFFHPPLRVMVVGNREDPVARAMLEKALATYVPSKVVLAIDPRSEPELLARHEFPTVPGPVTYLCLEHAGVAEITDANEVADQMVAAEDRRSRH